MTDKILFVDDEPHVLASYGRGLRQRYDIHTALGSTEALNILDENGPFAVVISDMKMPGMNGIEFLGQVRERFGDTVGIMLTGDGDQRTAIDAINEGQIFRFYTKPCSQDDLVQGIDAGVEQHRLVTAERALLEKTLAGSVKVLTDVLALTNPEAVGKAHLVRDWSVGAAKFTNKMSPWRISIAAMLSPIGQIVLPNEIVAKSRKGEELTAAERDVLCRAPEISRNLIANIPRLESVSEMVYYQYKNFDGSGFPEDAIAGTEIPLEARFLRILNDLGNIVDIRKPQSSYISELDSLAERSGRYDPDVFSSVRAYFISQEEGHGDAEGMEFMSLPVHKIRAGDILLSDIETDDGLLALAAGQKVTPVHREKLENLQRLCSIGQSVELMRPSTKARGQ